MSHTQSNLRPSLRKIAALRGRSARAIAALTLVPALALPSHGVAVAQEQPQQDVQEELVGTDTSIPTGSWTMMSSARADRPVFASDQDDFYRIDNVSPAAPGELLRTQTVSYYRAFGELDVNMPTTATRIMYTTTNQHGELVPVTGYVLEPKVAWKGGGPRPTVVIGRGTVGQGDKCAPSRNWPLNNQPDPLTSGRLVNFEGLYDWAFANNGVRVVVTDYIGMGTELMHTYMNRKDQGHAMLDAARAVRNLVGAEAFGNVGFYGHSQGGGASAAAVELAGEYAPDVNVAGAYASAPPADLDAVQRHIDGSDLTGAIGFTINGLIARYPHLRARLDEHLNEEGKQALDELAVSCTHELAKKFGEVTTTAMWTATGQRLDDIVHDMPDALEAIDDQLIGKGKNQAPIMIVSGKYDENVEYNQAKQLAANWCAAGGNVTYRDDILPQWKGYNHFMQSISGGAFGLGYMMDRFLGVPTPGNCNQAPGSSDGSSATGSAVGSSIGRTQGSS